MSSRNEDRETEDRIAAFAAMAVGARAQRIDIPGAGDGLRDFDLVFPDGSVEPLEVTSDTHQQTRQTSARAKHWTSHPTTLTRTWLLSFPRGTKQPIDVERVCREVVVPLRVAEALGVHTLGDAGIHDSSALSHAIRAIRALGVSSGTSLPPPDGIARLEFAVIYGDRVEVDVVADAVEEVARREDNRAKLREPPVASRRHLFVRLDWSSGTPPWAAHEAVEHNKMPRLPDLSEPITTVWALAGDAALVVTPPGPWQVEHVPSDFDKRYREWLVN